MTTIINTPTSPVESSDSILSIVVGTIVLLALAVLFFLYILPMINNSNATSAKDSNININVELPTVSTTP